MTIAVDSDVKPPNKQIIFGFPHQTGNIITMATRVLLVMQKMLTILRTTDLTFNLQRFLFDGTQ